MDCSQSQVRAADASNGASEESVGVIRAIDRTSVHQICSGQVILTLATAVKELVENSLDAGATNVEVRLKEYGIESIEVIDNGSGVEEKNFEALTLKHYTSKLTKFSDLTDVETFGFRGEALSSLCALSKLTITTSCTFDGIGTRLEFDHGGKLVTKKPCARQHGTSIVVEQLFTTLPVRHKEFLRNIKKEFAKMVQTLSAYCVIHTGVKLTCTNQTGSSKKTTVLSITGNSTIKENIADLFGIKQLQSLLEIKSIAPDEDVLMEYNVQPLTEDKEDLFSINGLISSCEHGSGRSSADRQFYFINRRPCDPNKIARLVNEVYHVFNRHQYPMVVLDILLSKDLVDVNVTPDKRQVFVQHEKLLLATIKTSLMKMFQPISTVCSSIGMGQTQSQNRSTESSKTEISNKTKVSVLKRNFASAFDRSVEEDKPESNTACQVKQIRLDGMFKTKTMNSKESLGCDEKVSSEGNEYAPHKMSTATSVDDCEQSTQLPTENSCTDLTECVQLKADDLNDKQQLNDQISLSDKSNFDINDDDSQDDCIISIVKSSNETVDSIVQHQDLVGKENQEGNESLIPVTGDVTVLKQGDNFKEREYESDEGFISLEAVNRSEPAITSARRANYMEMSNKDVTRNRKGISESSQHKTKVTITEIDTEQPVRKKIVMMSFSMELLKKKLEKKQKIGDSSELKAAERHFRAQISPSNNEEAENELKKELRKDMFEKMNIIGQFNLGFIIAHLNHDLFIIDQHATDEKYNYEQLEKNTTLVGQRLIQPQRLCLTAVNESILADNLEIFRKNGFEFVANELAPPSDRILLESIPTSKNWIFGKEDIEEMIFILSDTPGVMCRPSRIRQMLASRACRSSVMIGTALTKPEMKKLIVHMGEIEQPWNCPHGRPTIRHLINLDMISNTLSE